MATATSEIPLPEPFPLRSPNGPQMRERTLRTMSVLQNRLGNIAVRRALGRDLKPIQVARPLRKAFADLGATYVKFGQMVASSPAVFGQGVADEFRSLLGPFTREPAQIGASEANTEAR